MSTVKIRLAENGSMVRVYASNPEFGYVVLESSDFVMGKGSFVRESKRSHILKGSTDILQRYAASTKGVLPGKIAVYECVESQIPENYSSIIRKDIAYEEAISEHVKTDGSTGILMCGTERIMRFTTYDPAGKTEDVFVAHTHILKGAEAASGDSADDAAFPE